MHAMLERLASRPEPHSTMTIRDLWTRPHIARQMLAYHLDQRTELASRPIPAIDETVEWLDRQLGLEGKRVCDLGCGPGLYARRLARRGAEVTGVDFSAVAIAFAESQAASADAPVRYLVADYLEDELPADFDVVTLIYYDYGALSPTARRALLLRIRSMLRPGGVLVMDVAAEGAFRKLREQIAIEKRLMDGFWSDSDYVGVHRTWVYPGEFLSLDHYLIVEPSDQWEILNWTQFFSPDRLARELEQAGYGIRVLAGSLQGAEPGEGGSEIGVIAEASRS